MTGLWTVVQPCARPIKLETLNKKRLAVDASIWIYQFLKAVRDKEGNALRNSHVVGFFRRICKLLFFGIKPVFVFDGGAPALKRQTISGRKARREGRREDAVRTAGKLLALQMQRRAEEEDSKRREDRDRPTANREEEEEVPDDLVYVDELQMTTQERQQNRQFKKKDAYHLPDLDVSLSEMGGPNDPRIMSHEELEEYARQFHTGEDVNIYDFSKIDFNSPFFLSLPASDRYNILNAARLRSRLRMGYSKDQLDTMFPDRMAFSKFQIDRVKERNELTTRLMNLNGMNGEDAMLGNAGGRVAGEKGKEYVLVKNDGVEGGWALGVVSNRQEGERNQPIDVERTGKNTIAEDEEEDEWEDDGFEDVPIDGLNRLPKRTHGDGQSDHDDEAHSNEIFERRSALYKARQKAATSKSTSSQPPAYEDPDALFLASDDRFDDKSDDAEADELFEDVPGIMSEDDEELRRAIAMSLETPDSNGGPREDRELPTHKFDGPRIDQPLEFNSHNAQIGRSYAHMTNARASGAAPRPFLEDDNNDDDDDGDNAFDLQAALAESRQSKHRPRNGLLGSPHTRGFQISETPSNTHSTTNPPTTQSAEIQGSSVNIDSSKEPQHRGPLPFESLNLDGFFRKKKKVDEKEAGGFEKDSVDEKKPTPQLPPWFSGDVREGNIAQKAFEDKQVHGEISENRDGTPVLHRQKANEVIDLEAPKNAEKELVEVGSSSSDEDEVVITNTLPIDSEVRMGDIADLTRAEPPLLSKPTQDTRSPPKHVADHLGNEQIEENASGDEESVKWEESDLELDRVRHNHSKGITIPAGGTIQQESSKSQSPEFENVGILDSPTLPQPSSTIPTQDHGASLLFMEDGFEKETIDDIPPDDDEVYSDPEDDDLMRQLAVEAEEHARFASTLNSKSQVQNAEDYERELRQLRNQQKKDRRDADEVSHIMITECQQLLKLFGLPYITAPMEAEAQCAELVSLGLVDGIVTDDSDIFLFGGTRIYKNMFNQAKFVECYLSSDLEKEYSLDRNRVIQIAHLLGSDYTEGIPTIGPVTALEILSEFESLEAFKEWWSKVQTGHKLPQEDNASPFRRKFKRNAAKLFLPPTFPDKRVDHAYLNPEVDSDPSPFAWGVPDLDALRQFLMATIGWSQERADEILVPVIKDMNRRENEGTQANITQFFGGAVGVGARERNGNAFAPRRRVEGKSQRMENALGRLHARARERTFGVGERRAVGEAEAVQEIAPEVVNDTGEILKGSGKRKAKKPAAKRVDGPNTDSPSRAANKRRIRKRPMAVEADVSGSESNDDYEVQKKSKRRRKGVRKA